MYNICFENYSEQIILALHKCNCSFIFMKAFTKVNLKLKKHAAHQRNQFSKANHNFNKSALTFFQDCMEIWKKPKHHVIMNANDVLCLNSLNAPNTCRLFLKCAQPNLISGFIWLKYKMQALFIVNSKWNSYMFSVCPQGTTSLPPFGKKNCHLSLCYHIV